MKACARCMGGIMVTSRNLEQTDSEIQVQKDFIVGARFSVGRREDPLVFLNQKFDSGNHF